MRRQRAISSSSTPVRSARTAEPWTPSCPPPSRSASSGTAWWRSCRRGASRSPACTVGCHGGEDRRRGRFTGAMKRYAFGLAALVIGPCYSTLGPGGGVVEGTWGGKNAGLIATDSTAHVHIGCTLGDTQGGIVPGPDRSEERRVGKECRS